MSRLELIATSAFGLESVVSRELTQLGYHDQRVEDGRVTFVGDELAICRCNLWLRSADRVLVKVGAFAADDFETLFQQVMALPGPIGCRPMRSFPSAESPYDPGCTTSPAFRASPRKRSSKA